MLRVLISVAALHVFFYYAVAEVIPLDVPKTTRHRRTVGGLRTPSGSYPYVVSIRIPGIVHLCGGTIISPSVILTAGHCIYRYPNQQFLVLVQSNDLKAGGSIYNVTEKILHHKYRRVRTSYNDIGLLKLERPIVGIESTEIVKLAKKDEAVPIGSVATVVGWGALYNDMHEWKLHRDRNETVEERVISMKELLSGYTAQLRSVNITVVSRDRCKADLTLWYKNIKFSREVCTSDPKKGTCRGDSGTPLMLGERQIGIVSGSRKCGGQPTIHTNVAAYRCWIDEKVELLTHSRESTRS